MFQLIYIPKIVVGLRLTIAAFLLLDAIDRHVSIWFIVAYIIAVLSDIFDGIIALWLAIGMCIVNSLEEIVMTLILPKWKCDVLSVFAAIELRTVR